MTWTRLGSTFSEVAIGDSNKTFEVIRDTGLTQPDVLRVERIRLEYTATGTGGTRQLSLELTDVDGDVIWNHHLPATEDIVAAGTLLLEFEAGVDLRVPAVDGGPILLPLTRHLRLERGHKLKIFDRNNIESSVDLMVLHLTAERSFAR